MSPPAAAAAAFVGEASAPTGAADESASPVAPFDPADLLQVPPSALSTVDDFFAGLRRRVGRD
jgi:hypothetical protein